MKYWLKPAAFIAAGLPFAVLIWDVVTENLSPNPIEDITHYTGAWSLRLLLLTLAMTPLRTVSGWTWPLKLRRMFGLFAFFYVCLHFSIYVFLDLQWDFSLLGEDIAKRPYITVGFSSFVLLIPLALTSWNGAMRRLGRRWKQLHRLVYLIAILSVLHFAWLVKADVVEPLLYAALLLILLASRVAPLKGFLARE